MELHPIPLRILTPQDDLPSLLRSSVELRPRDIVVVSSKAIATAEGAQIDLQQLQPTVEAVRLSQLCGRSPQFVEAVLQEVKMLQGSIVGTCVGALLTEVRPPGLQRGVLLTLNAGLDEFNTPQGSAIGWPKDPPFSARKLQQQLDIPIIISDNCNCLRRWGRTAFALACAGIDAFESEVHKHDLYGRELPVSIEARADQLAAAAALLMNSGDNQSIPAVRVRGLNYKTSSFCGWVDSIEQEEDLFQDLLQMKPKQKQS